MTAQDYTGKTVKVGDTVDFKEDIEGTGKVLEIITRRSSWGGSSVTFIIGQLGEQDSYPWHRMATDSFEHKGKVVYTERVWLVN